MMYFDRRATHYILEFNGLEEDYIPIAKFKVNIQPATGEAIALTQGGYGTTFTAFTTYSGLKVNDVITTSGTTTYSGMYYNVKAVRAYDYGGLQHFEAIVTLPEI